MALTPTVIQISFGIEVSQITHTMPKACAVLYLSNLVGIFTTEIFRATICTLYDHLADCVIRQELSTFYRWYGIECALNDRNLNASNWSSDKGTLFTGISFLLWSGGELLRGDIGHRQRFGCTVRCGDSGVRNNAFHSLYRLR